MLPWKGANLAGSGDFVEQGRVVGIETARQAYLGRQRVKALQEQNWVERWR